MTRDRLTDTVVLIVDGGRSIDKLAMYAEISARGREKMAEIVIASPSRDVERAMRAFDASTVLLSEPREYRATSPRHQDRTPRSPKPRFRKGR